MHSTEFYDSVKNTGARQPSSIVSRMRIESRREYFCLVNFQFTSESKTDNCKQGPQGPDKNTPFRVQAQKHPFFDFEYKLMKKKKKKIKIANMLKKKNDHAYTKSIQSDNTGKCPRFKRRAFTIQI